MKRGIRLRDAKTAQFQAMAHYHRIPPGAQGHQREKAEQIGGPTMAARHSAAGWAGVRGRGWGRRGNAQFFHDIWVRIAEREERKWDKGGIRGTGKWAGTEEEAEYLVL